MKGIWLRGSSIVRCFGREEKFVDHLPHKAAQAQQCVHMRWATMAMLAQPREYRDVEWGGRSCLSDGMGCRVVTPLFMP